MKTERKFAVAISFSFLCLSITASAFALETPDAGGGIKILQEESTTDIVVRPTLGLRATLGEITDKLADAQKKHVLTNVETNEFSRRAKELQQQLGGHLDYQTGQALSKDLYQLSQDINRGLQRTQQLAMYYCPDGSCPTTKEQLTFEYKQLKRDIKDAVASGSLAPVDGSKYRSEAAALMRTTNEETAENQQLAYVSKRFHKLSLHVQAVATAGHLSQRPPSSTFLTMPGPF